MNQQRSLWLLLAVVLLSGLAYVLASHRAEQAPMASEGRLFPDFSAQENRLSRFQIRHDHQTLDLKKNGEIWNVADKSYPADSGKLRKLVDLFASARIVEAKTALPENYAQLGVADPGKQGAGIEVGAYDGDRLIAKLIVGRNASASRGMFVRRAGEAQSFLIDEENALNAEAKNWLASSIAAIAPDAIQRIEVKAATPYVLARASHGQTTMTLSPIPEGKIPAADYVLNGVADALNALELTDVYPAPMAEFDRGERIAADFYGFDGLVVHSEVLSRADDALLRLSARFDVEQAKRFAKDGKLDETAIKAGEARAAELNGRWSPWVFSIYSMRGKAFAHPLADLVQDAPKPATQASAEKAVKASDTEKSPVTKAASGGKR